MPNLKGLGKVAAVDAPVIRKYLEQFAYIPILDGQLVEAVFPAGATSVQIRHSLGRSYLGVVIVGVSAALNVQGSLTTATAESRTFFTLLAPVAPGSDTQVKVWVF